MKEIMKYIGVMLIPLGLSMASCSSNNDEPEVPGLVAIYNIKILNAGETGTVIVEGTVDENKKEISFPEIDPKTDLSNIRFEAELPEGAEMEQDEYDFTIPEGRTNVTKVIAVVNGKRKREYFATIRLDLPVWGADFTAAKMKVYDFSSQTTMYSDFASSMTRSADMDKDHVLIISRAATGLGPHLLKLEDLKKGDASKPIKLNTTGVSGGTFAYSSGKLAQGHIYVCNLGTPSDVGSFKIYHWASPNAMPTCIGEYFSANLIGFTSGRFGDQMSMNIDDNGDGYMFFGVNPSQTAYKVLRIKVTGFTALSNPTLINVGTFGGLWANYNQVDGSPDDYLYTGHQGPIMLVDAGGQLAYTIPATFIPIADGSDARIVTFNQERYLIMMATPGAGSVNVYDVTEGNTIVEALGLLVEENRAALLRYSLGGSIGAGTASANTAWVKDGDETLYLFGAAPDAGFVILECPKKVKE